MPEFTCYLKTPKPTRELKFMREVYVWKDEIVWLECDEQEAQMFARNFDAARLRKGHHDLDLKEDVFSQCENCHGRGRYFWGACINGVMSHSGPCFRCESKGYQTVDDRKRNWGYDNHRKVY